MVMKDGVLTICMATACALFSVNASAVAVVLDSSTSCNAGNSTIIAVTDVTGNVSGSNECWGAFDGNTPGPSGDGFDVGGTIFDFVAKEDTPGGLSGTDIGLIVTPNGGASSGTWEFDSSKFAPTEFLIVLKAANTPGYAVWLFDGAAAASDAGTWLVPWTNQNGNPRNLSHLSVYAPTVIPVPAAVWLFGSGLLGLVAVARRRRA